MMIVNNYIAVQQKADIVYWFQGNLPVFRHHVADEDSFRLFCCQMINIGTVSAAEIAVALGVNREKLSRWARAERSSIHLESSKVLLKKKKKRKRFPCINF
jgi:hypothetical protein